MVDEKHIIGKTIHKIGKIGKWFFIITGFWIIALSPFWTYDLACHGILTKGKLISVTEGFLKNLGFDYCQAGNILRDGFATLFTAMSLVFTICMSLMNRSADLIYGVSRIVLIFNGKEFLYKCGSRVVYGAPLFMALAVNLGYTMSGYAILFIVYGYLLFCYGIYGWTFDGKANEERMTYYLSKRFPQNLSDRKKLGAYRKILAGIGASVRNDNDWQGVKELVYSLLKEGKGLSKEQKFIQVYVTYNDIFPGKASNVLLEVLLGSLRLLDKWRLQEDNPDVEKYQLSVWAMLCSAFPKLSDTEIVQFLVGLLDFEGRIVAMNRENDGRYKNSQLEIMKVEAGMALVLLECRLNNVDRVSEGLMKLFPQVWDQGKYLFADNNRDLFDKATEYYKKWSVLPDDQWDIYMQNLRRDYGNNSTYSIIRNLDD